jgi:PAS domain S-box-containing protein
MMATGPTTMEKSGRDITDQKKTEEYILLLAKMSDNAPVSITVHDFDGTMLYANEATFRLHGDTREEYLAKNLHEIDVPDSEHLIAERMTRIREKGEADFEVQHFRKDGSILPLHVNAKIVDWGGRKVLLSIATDLTERKHAELQLKKTEMEFRSLIQSSADIIAVLDPAGDFLFLSPSFDTILGYHHTRTSIRNMFELVHPDDVRMVRERMQFSIEHPGVVHTLELRVRHADGSWRILEEIGSSSSWGEHDRVFIVNARDITGRKRAEETLLLRTKELDDRNRLINTFMDTVPIGVFMVEVPSGRPIIANPEAIRLMGRGILPDATEMNLSEVYEAYKVGTSERYPTKEMPIVRGMQGESSHIDDMEVVRPDGTRIQLEIFGNPIKDTQGIIVGSLASFLDITDRKRSEEQLRMLNREKEILLREIHHRVRNVIQLAVSMMEIEVRGENDERVQQLIRGTQKRLNAIASTFDKLYYSRNMSRVNLQQVIKAIVGSLKTSQGTGKATIQTGIHIDFEELGVDLALPLALIASELVNNSLQHAFPGGRSGMVTITGTDDGKGCIIMTVSDNGSGLPEGLNPDDCRTTGLKIVRLLLQQIRGRLTYESGGKGTSFVITVPRDGEYNKSGVSEV